MTFQELMTLTCPSCIFEMLVVSTIFVPGGIRPMMALIFIVYETPFDRLIKKCERNLAGLSIKGMGTFRKQYVWTHRLKLIPRLFTQIVFASTETIPPEEFPCRKGTHTRRVPRPSDAAPAFLAIRMPVPMRGTPWSMRVFGVSQGQRTFFQ